MKLLLILLCCSTCFAEEIRGKCVSVSDGDTITILCGKEQVKVRLSSIDAPERKQPFGTKSKEHLAAMVHEKLVTVKTAGQDRYGRTLGTVFVDGKDVNHEQVRAGMAWHFKRYSKDPELARLEHEARAERRGLWADKEPVPPWEWRKSKSSAN